MRRIVALIAGCFLVVLPSFGGGPLSLDACREAARRTGRLEELYALSEVESEESDDEKKKNEEKEPRTVKAPNKKMQEISAQAASMGTTLWFTQKDKKAGMPEALFATGQFTICYKLLSYIRRIKKAKENDETTANLNEGHDTLIELEPRLLEFWSRFLEDPKCMLP